MRLFQKYAVLALTGLLASSCVRDYPQEPYLALVPTGQYTLGGEVLGLNGTLELTNNGEDTLTITSDGVFQFPENYPSGASYNVSITSSPLNQDCSISSNVGVLLSDVTGVFVQCQDTSVTIDNIQRLYLSSQGGANNTSSIDWTPQYTENFEIRIGTDCATGALGTFTNNSGTTVTGVQETSVINQTDLVPGNNTIHICILDGSSNLIDSNSFTIVRDDVSPIVAFSTAPGSYASPQSLEATCIDPGTGCNALVYTIQDVALPGAANPADPAVATNGTPTTGSLYSGPLSALDLRNTQFEIIGIDRAGNRSAVLIGNYSVDATLPSLTLGAPGRDFISNTAGAPYDSSGITWTSNRSNMDYFVWYGASDCQGTGGTSITSGTTTGAGDTVTVAASSIPVGVQTITVAERNFAGFYGCQTYTLTRDDTAPTVVAGGTPDGSTLAYDDEVDIRLSEQIDTSSIAVGGGDLDAEAVLPPTVTTTSNTDDTILISPTTYWTPGASRNVTVDVRDRAGNLLNLSLNYDLPDGSVEPMYATAPNWNEYVRNDGNFIYDAAGTVCDGSETGFITSCLHAGELRKVEVLTANSCAGLTATDANGWFEWACYDPPGPGPIWMYTLRRTSSLRDYINFGTQTWNTNTVSVSNGWTTAANAWWSNPLVSVGAGGISMNTSGTIYNAPASVTTTGAITADVNGVTFVTAPGVSLETNVAAHQISVNNHDFIWIETRMSHIDGSGSSSGIFIRDSAFVTVENSFLANYPGFGSAGQVRLINNRALLFRNMIIANNQSSSGINVYADGADSHHLWFDQVRVFNNGSGLFFRGNSPGVIRDMLVTRSIFQNNASFGISADQGIQNSLFMNVLTANNGGDGLDLRGTILSSGNTVMNLVSVNNGGGGLLPGDNSQFINLGFSDNSTDDVLAPVGTGNIYSGVLYSGQASLVPDDRDGRCTAVGAGSGMANDGDCSPEGPSDHTVISAFDLSDQFRGPNGSPAAYNIGLAWFMLANQYMGFGRSLLIPLSYPDNSHRGQCDGTALTGCDRYDWQLVNTAPSPGFRNALSCAGMTPAVTHTFTTGSYTFLRNSYEIATDAKWDLPMCMGDESCLFTPNLGAYQGHGGIVDSGCADLSADPTFGDVDFREMNTNGVP